LAGRAIRANAPKSRLHDEEKTLNSEFGELLNVHMKDLTLELKTYQKFAAFFNVTAHRFKLSRIHGLGYSHCARATKFIQSTPAFECTKNCIYNVNKGCLHKNRAGGRL